MSAFLRGAAATLLGTALLVPAPAAAHVTLEVAQAPVGSTYKAVMRIPHGCAGAATTTEVKFETKQGDKTYGQCLVFAWIEATPRKNPQTFTCDDVAAVEKWKIDQALKSAWR